MASLESLVSWIHRDHCNFQLSDGVVKDIENLVVNLVKVLLPELLRNYPGCRFSVAEVIEAGSYFEKTKIELPNEFDFMLVVEQLSSEEAIIVMKGCREGYARVGVRDPGLWDETRADDSPERKFEIALLQFNMYVRETLKLALTEPLTGRFGQLRLKDITVRGKPYKAFSHVQTLTLVWTSYTPEKAGHAKKKHSTNTEVLYQRQHSQEGLGICVDLMSCCHLPLSAFSNILPEKSLENKLLKQNGCHIVLKSCESARCREKESQCRLISYTKTEQECMRKISVRWKVVYKVLKWMFHYTDVLEIDTYKVKTAVLYCSSNSGSDSVISLADGLIKVLEVLRNSAYSHKLPGYFNSSLNIWTVSPCYQYLVKYKMIFLLKVFSKMRSMPSGDDHAALTQNMNIVNLWLTSFCSHAAEISHMTSGRSSRLQAFNRQGNVFLEIMKEMEPALKSHHCLAWVPFQMKCYVLLDVFKVLTSLCLDKIANLWHPQLYMIMWSI